MANFFLLSVASDRGKGRARAHRRGERGGVDARPRSDLQIALGGVRQRRDRAAQHLDQIVEVRVLVRVFFDERLHVVLDVVLLAGERGVPGLVARGVPHRAVRGQRIAHLDQLVRIDRHDARIADRDGVAELLAPARDVRPLRQLHLRKIVDDLLDQRLDLAAVDLHVLVVFRRDVVLQLAHHVGDALEILRQPLDDRRVRV